MAGKLMDFLLELGKDPDALARFIARPDETMRAAALSAEERKILRSRNPHQIHQALTAAFQGFAPGPYPTSICMYVWGVTARRAAARPDRAKKKSSAAKKGRGKSGARGRKRR